MAESGRSTRDGVWAFATWDVVDAVEQIARESGASVQEVITEVDRRGLGLKPGDKKLRKVINRNIDNRRYDNRKIDNSRHITKGDSFFAPVLNILSDIRFRVRAVVRIPGDDNGYWALFITAFLVIAPIAALGIRIAYF